MIDKLQQIIEERRRATAAAVLENSPAATQESPTLVDPAKAPTESQTEPPQKEEIPAELAEPFYEVNMESDPRFLDFRFADGSRVAFPYASLGSINYDPEESRLDLDFGNYMISLFGENLLGPMYHWLCAGRLQWVRESFEGEQPDVVEFVARIELASFEEEIGDQEDQATKEDLT